MNIFKELKGDLERACREIYSDNETWQKITLESPKDPLNGDISTNAAMIIAAKLGKNPREIAADFKNLLINIPYIAHVEVAGPGFVNFTIKAEKWHSCIRAILSENSDFWQVNAGNNKKVNVEYVSANPTGPLHIGHARGAVFGDVLANILHKCGYKVTKEYYVNDAGTQVEILTESVILRYRQLLGEDIEIASGLYPGEYLIDVAKDLQTQHGDKLLELPADESRKIVQEKAISSMLELIKNDLKDLGVEHDLFFSEASLHEQNKISAIVEQLKEDSHVYLGTLPPPKGKIDQNWQEREQLLFKSTAFKDDQDRPVQKSDGKWTYFAADLAYAKNKIDRGFDKLIYVLGADHIGYVRRIEAVVNAISIGKVGCKVCTNQLVNFVRDGKPLKMSKRQGTFMTVGDVLDTVDKDIIRFMLLSRRSDMVIDFDIDKVKQQSKDNPVFYVQYANVRVKSILQNAKANMPQIYEKFSNNDFDLSVIESEEEIRLIKLLSSWPKVLESAALYLEPQRIVYYLIDVASSFHSLWNLGKEDRKHLFLQADEVEISSCRLALASATEAIITEGLRVMGVVPLEKM